MYLDKNSQIAQPNKKKAFNKLLKQYEAFSKKRLSGSDMLVAVPKFLGSQNRNKIRSESVKIDIDQIENFKYQNMNLTSYSMGFNRNKPKFANRSVVEEKQSSGFYDNTKINQLKNTLSMFTK